jgi:carbon-monoxide dehydrogenase medium subunit
LYLSTPVPSHDEAHNWYFNSIGGVSVIPGSFDYIAAKSVPEAIALLEQHGDEAKILAGGQSLIPLLRFRLAAPSILIDINHIQDLEYMQETDGTLHIGALTREAELDQSPLIRNRYPILVDTSSMVADPVVRNWATVGGNLAHADPANDHPATMLALGASVVIQGSAGQRVIPITDFFTDSTFETTLQANEIMTEIRIPAPPDGVGARLISPSGGAYLKLERKVGDYGIAGVAVYFTFDDQGLVATAGIGLTNVGPYPIKAYTAEQFLVGKRLDEATIQQAADLVVAASQPTSDSRGPAEYKRAMVHVLCIRAMHKALTRATGEE